LGAAFKSLQPFPRPGNGKPGRFPNFLKGHPVRIVHKINGPIRFGLIFQNILQQQFRLRLGKTLINTEKQALLAGNVFWMLPFFFFFSVQASIGRYGILKAGGKLTMQARFSPQQVHEHIMGRIQGIVPISENLPATPYYHRPILCIPGRNINSHLVYYTTHEGVIFLPLQ
jgi:hypothetical protein